VQGRQGRDCRATPPLRAQRRNLPGAVPPAVRNGEDALGHVAVFRNSARVGSSI
jgi:hypothetical protein